MDITLPNYMKLIETKDGSPSMEIFYGEVSEIMHNSSGAFAESLYIYEQALIEAHQRSFPIRVLSVGLGLGYNEIISTGFCVANHLPFSLVSFEAQVFLRKSFLNWVCKEDSPLTPVYKKILELTASHFSVEPIRIHDGLFSSLKENSLSLEASFPLNYRPADKFSVVYFDPFSAKANPDFWTEEFLDHFLSQICGKPCVFSTYAATGKLKRALQRQNFSVDLRNGFAGKRNSTFAVRIT